MLKKNCKSQLISLVLFLISFSCSSAFAEAINVKKEKSASEAEVQLAFNADLNPMLKMMAVKPLTNFLNLLVQKLKEIP